MHEMDFQRHVCAVHRVLARRVEMKLLQLIGVLVRRQGAATVHRDLDRVPVVDDVVHMRMVGDLEGRFVVVQLPGAGLTRLRFGDVDGRLALFLSSSQHSSSAFEGCFFPQFLQKGASLYFFLFSSRFFFFSSSVVLFV